MKLWLAAMLLTLTVPCLTTAERKGMYDMETLNFSSPAFNSGEAILPRYGSDGADAGPPLVNIRIPATAQTPALFMDDPDASLLFQTFMPSLPRPQKQTLIRPCMATYWHRQS